jgi:D-glycero-D-manno-heptose 1,7-bisphosphate phosphatase
VLDLTRYTLIAFDVDGTLRRCTVPGQPCPNRPGEWDLLPNVRERIAALGDGVAVAMITNQGGVGLGHLTRPMVYSLLDALAQRIDGDYAVRGHSFFGHPYVCEHRPDAGCVCRKPSPFLLWKAIHERQLCPRDTLYVGDLDSDRLCAERAGVDFAWAHDFFGWEKP